MPAAADASRSGNNDVCVPSTRSLAADNAKVEKRVKTTSSKKKDDKKLPPSEILNF